MAQRMKTRYEGTPTFLIAKTDQKMWIFPENLLEILILQKIISSIRGHPTKYVSPGHFPKENEAVSIAFKEM